MYLHALLSRLHVLLVVLHLLLLLLLWVCVQEASVHAAHVVLHWKGLSRGALRVAVGPFAAALLDTAQRGALLRSNSAAAVS